MSATQREFDLTPTVSPVGCCTAHGALSSEERKNTLLPTVNSNATLANPAEIKSLPKILTLY